MFDSEIREWLIKSIIILSKQLHNIQRGLDTLLSASTNVSKEQLAKLTKDSTELKAMSDKLTSAIEQQKKGN